MSDRPRPDLRHAGNAILIVALLVFLAGCARGDTDQRHGGGLYSGVEGGWTR